MKFDDLSDDQILIGLDFLVGGTRHTMAQLIGYLAIVLSRQLYARQFESLYDYCVRGLNMSDSDARRRAETAQLALHFPPVIDMLKYGTLTEDDVALMTEAEIRSRFVPQSGVIPLADSSPRIVEDDPDRTPYLEDDDRHANDDDGEGEGVRAVTLGFPICDLESLRRSGSYASALSEA